MIAAYKKFWKQYSDFKGRSSRSDYWWVYLCQFLITLPFVAILSANLMSAFISAVQLAESGATDEVVGMEILSAMFAPGNIFVWIVLVVYSLATFVPGLALTVRRLRDGGFHWAMIFISFIPYVGPLVLLILLALPTKAVFDPYGSNPSPHQ